MTNQEPVPAAAPGRFPVVGVGASAGGLEALKQLFGGLPTGSGLGYVVVQHLDPTHESLTVDLLGRHTAMPVVQIADGMEVAPDRVHVIPPNRYLTLADGRLQLRKPPEPRGMHMPVDHFFRSLAEALEEYAICIVLSGTGADGILGLREIKGHGGMVMVQAPESAQYDGMPRSAPATGLVDYLLELERMPEALVKYVRRFHARGATAERPPEEQALHEVQRSEERFRILFEKSPMFLCEQDWSGVLDYLRQLAADPDDLRAYFFAHPEAVRRCLKLIRLTKANEATLLLFGAGEENELLTDAARFFGSECLKEFVGMLCAVSRRQTGYAYEECIETLAGEEIPVIIQFQVMPGYEGDLARVLVTLVDIRRRKEVERALHEREYRLRAILDNAADALITVDGEGRIQNLNRAAEGMFGIAGDQAEGSDFRSLIPLAEAPEDAKGARVDFLEEFIRRPRPRQPWLRIERTGLRADGSRFPLDINIGEIDHLDQFSLIIRDLSERKRLEQEVIEASTMEQERIGREIHDGLGQQLTALDLLAASLSNKLKKAGNPAAPMAAELERNLRLALREARAVARGLAPVEIDPSGLGAALERLAEDSRTATGIDCRVHAPRPVAIADARTATHLYRIVQEAVNNAVKHARPRRIELELEQDDGQIQVCVSDDGPGLQTAPPGDTGLGLHIMRYRARLIGARLKISANGEKGTRVCCTLPAEVPR